MQRAGTGHVVFVLLALALVIHYQSAVHVLAEYICRRSSVTSLSPEDITVTPNTMLENGICFTKNISFRAKKAFVVTNVTIDKSEDNVKLMLLVNDQVFNLSTDEPIVLYSGMGVSQFNFSTFSTELSTDETGTDDSDGNSEEWCPRINGCFIDEALSCQHQQSTRVFMEQPCSCGVGSSPVGSANIISTTTVTITQHIGDNRNFNTCSVLTISLPLVFSIVTLLFVLGLGSALCLLCRKRTRSVNIKKSPTLIQFDNSALYTPRVSVSSTSSLLRNEAPQESPMSCSRPPIVYETISEVHMQMQNDGNDSQEPVEDETATVCASSSSHNYETVGVTQANKISSPPPQPSSQNNNQ